MPRHCWRSRATRFWMSRWPPASERTSIFPEFFGDRWAYRPATIAPSCDGSLPFDTQLERCCTREREFITIAQLDSYSRLDLTVVHESPIRAVEVDEIAAVATLVNFAVEA